MHIQNSIDIFCPALRLLSVGALTLSLSGCDLLVTLAKEAAVSATSHSSWDMFTFKGQLPAEFGIDAIAFYGPKEPGKASCQTPSFEPGKTITRRHTQQYTAEIQAQPQAFSFEIPLSYYKGLCGMRLGRVKLEINARYGTQEWQQAYGQGNIYIERHTATPIANPTDNDLKMSISASCTWLFQQSKARSIFGEIEKRLICRGAGIKLQENALANKIVYLSIEENPEEEPSRHKTWIKFTNGWKPCLPEEGWQSCQNPPVFKTFRMNGRTCTVYPHCKEQ